MCTHKYTKSLTQNNSEADTVAIPISQMNKSKINVVSSQCEFSKML